MAEDYKNDEVLKEHILKSYIYIGYAGIILRKPSAREGRNKGPQFVGLNRSKTGNAAWTVIVKKIPIPAENIAFLLINGRWPDGKIGFKSGRKCDINWKNLITEGL